MDQPVGIEVSNWHLGIPETNADDRNAGAAGDADIRTGIADHDRGGNVAARAGDRLLQDGRIGLGDAECIGAADGGKPRAQSEPVQEKFRQPLQLVGADRKAESACPEVIERPFQAFERSRNVGDMLGIVGDEIVG